MVGAQSLIGAIDEGEFSNGLIRGGPGILARCGPTAGGIDL